jgi:hypothetical protein
VNKNATLEERAVPKYHSLAKAIGYRLNHPNHKPDYIPALAEVADSAREYSARMRQEAEKQIRYSRKY